MLLLLRSLLNHKYKLKAEEKAHFSTLTKPSNKLELALSRLDIASSELLINELAKTLRDMNDIFPKWDCLKRFKNSEST